MRASSCSAPSARARPCPRACGRSRARSARRPTRARTTRTSTWSSPSSCSTTSRRWRATGCPGICAWRSCATLRFSTTIRGPNILGTFWSSRPIISLPAWIAKKRTCRSKARTSSGAGTISARSRSKAFFPSSSSTAGRKARTSSTDRGRRIPRASYRYDRGPSSSEPCPKITGGRARISAPRGRISAGSAGKRPTSSTKRRSGSASGSGGGCRPRPATSRTSRSSTIRSPWRPSRPASSATTRPGASSWTPPRSATARGPSSGSCAAISLASRARSSASPPSR